MHANNFLKNNLADLKYQILKLIAKMKPDFKTLIFKNCNLRIFTRPTIFGNHNKWRLSGIIDKLCPL